MLLPPDFFAGSNVSIDPIQDRLPTLRYRLSLDCVADWSDRSGMVAPLLIAVCYAAGLAVHYRWYERSAVLSLSFDEPVDHAGWR
jgi:hypothetical protein